MAKKKASLMEATELLKVFARDITHAANDIEVARRNNMPLYEVVSCNGTLDLSRKLQDMNQLFDKTPTCVMYKVVGRYKKVFRAKKNHTLLSISTPTSRMAPGF